MCFKANTFIRVSVGIILITIICLFATIRIFEPYHDVYTKKNIVDNNYIETKFLLYWTPFWTHKDFAMGLGKKPFKHCEYKNCYATNDRHSMPIEEFHAIVFHFSIYNESVHGVPKKRLPHQIYIYSNFEAPTNYWPLNANNYSSFYNWTMTYRFDSDVIRAYGKIFKQSTNYVMPSNNFLSNKTKLAAWFVSHCKTNSARETLVKNIQKYMPVDVYGKCGPLNCATKKNVSKISSTECYSMLEQNYKFYLSFENAYCIDYASEKLYNILKLNVVPVVYGASDYKNAAPPHSIINAADFKNAKELAAYLSYLDKHVEEYLKYFEWKKTYKIISSDAACQICKKLHQPIQQSIYHDIHKWWWEEKEDNPVCKIGKGLPDIVSNLL